MRKTRGQAKKKLEKRRRTVRKQRGGGEWLAAVNELRTTYDATKTFTEIVGNPPALDEEAKKQGLDLLTLTISTGLFDGAMTPAEFTAIMKGYESGDETIKTQYATLLTAENAWRGDNALTTLSVPEDYPLYLWYLLVPLADTVKEGGLPVQLESVPLPPKVQAAIDGLKQPVAPAEPAPSDVSTRRPDLPQTSMTNAS
jgi:hypothetical protein